MSFEENVRVAAVFDPGRQPRPVWFDWKSRKYQVKAVSYTWKSRAGGTTFLHFAVTDGTNLFQLSYNPFDMSWKLVNLEDL